MKLILFATCIIGMAICAPPQMFEEFDIHHAPAEAARAIPAGAAPDTLEVLLPVDSRRVPVGGPARGFIKHEIPKPNGGDDEMYYPFGFEAPAAPVAPVVAVAPVAPAAPVVVVVAKTSEDEEEEED